jgi:hypothetical protein
MTEAEWFGSDDPLPMLDFLRGKVGMRKLRLLLVGVARQLWHDLEDDRSRRAIEVAELYADGKAEADQMSQAAWLAGKAREESWTGKMLEARTLAWVTVSDHEGDEADDLTWPVTLAGEMVAKGDGDPYPDFVAELTRCIFGNPFQRVAADRFWLTPTVIQLALGVYDERAFDRLPILADALEDAGCTDATLLDHLRGPGPHVRGCFALDLVLGKS